MIGKFRGALLAACLGLLLPAAAGAQPALPDDFEVGIEAGWLGLDLGDGMTLSGTTWAGGDVIETAVEDRLGDVTLTKALVKVSYLASPVAAPYLVVGQASLSLENSYRGFAIAGTVADGTVEFDGSGVAFGLGSEGQLLMLPASITLGYDARLLAFAASDSAESAVPGGAPEDLAGVDTEVRYSEWRLALTASRDFAVPNGITLTPHAGFRHSSARLRTTSDVKLRVTTGTGLRVFEGSLGRTFAGDLNSVVLGCSARFGGRLSGFVRLVAIGETGAEAGISYSF